MVQEFVSFMINNSFYVKNAQIVKVFCLLLLVLPLKFSTH